MDLSASDEAILAQVQEKERFSSQTDLIEICRFLMRLSLDKKIARGTRLREATGGVKFEADDELICERVTYSSQQKSVIVSILENYFFDDKSRKASTRFFNSIPGYERMTASILRKWFSRNELEKARAMHVKHGIMDEAVASAINPGIIPSRPPHVSSASIIMTILNYAAEEDFDASNEFVAEYIDDDLTKFDMFRQIDARLDLMSACNSIGFRLNDPGLGNNDKFGALFPQGPGSIPCSGEASSPMYPLPYGCSASTGQLSNQITQSGPYSHPQRVQGLPPYQYP
jgi:hypothetical protein